MNLLKRFFLLFLFMLPSLAARSQSVIFPQPQQAGVARLEQADGLRGSSYRLGNDLFCAVFEVQDGQLSFSGCDELGLKLGSELFGLRLADGQELTASQMTLADVRAVDLHADASAVKGALHDAGKAVEADFAYGDLHLTWRAVLRDGSHYLRTELALTAQRDVPMSAVTPMLYVVENASSQQAPAVVGNTRGAVIASDHIFAGLETPMGICTAGGNVATEPFAYASWTGTTFSWTPGDETPQAIRDLGYAPDYISGVRGYLAIGEGGRHTVKFQYTRGSHRLDIAGVDALDPFTGKVVASDYHKGTTGGSSRDNSYALDIPEAGYYLIRYFRDRTEEITGVISGAFNSNGTITWSGTVSAPQVVYDGNIDLNQTPVGASSIVLNNPVLTSGTARSDAWQPSSWQSVGDVPARILELGFAAESIRRMEKAVAFDRPGGTFNAQFMYASGYHGLTIAGVELVDADGQAVASDFHRGFSGRAKTDIDYTFTVPAVGDYTLRYYAVLNADGSDNTSTGSINLSYNVAEYLHLPAPTETPIRGEWSRQTTLRAGQTWKVSAVVGLIAPGQARRSFLAYSERERAVPWRPFPMYNSWFELNINRNNDPAYTTNFNEAQCAEVLEQWKAHLFDPYGVGIGSFVWDDGWDEYGTWQFNPNFPNGFQTLSDKAWAMDSHIGAWLGPVGGYGQSGNYRRNYWSSRGGMQLSNPAYYQVFLDRTSYMLNTYHFNYFKFDGISAQFSAVGPDAGATGEENAEGIIAIEQRLREVKPDVFLNTTVGTWASPYWFQVTDAVWRQENDWGTAGNQGNTREQWITYRDRLVYQNFVQNSPLCPINALMTHGFMLSNYGGGVASMSRSYADVVREMRCAFACGSGMVEIYADYALMNSINGGRLWGELADCIRWQQQQADVLPDVHWVGGNPWDGTNANVYGWASWNGKKATLALRNPAAKAQVFKTTLRQALDIPDYVSTTVTLSPAFTQNSVSGLQTDEPIDIDKPLSISLPASSVFVFNGVDNSGGEVGIQEARQQQPTPNGTTFPDSSYDLAGRRVKFDKAPRGIYVVGGKKVMK